MPKKIDDLTREGLPSKLYFVAYRKPNTIYGISKEIYGYPQPQKLFKWRDELVEKGYLKKVGNKWKSLPAPIFEQITKILHEQNIELTSYEEKQVLDILDCDAFRWNLRHVSIDLNVDFDAASLIIMIFDGFLTHSYLLKKSYPILRSVETNEIQMLNNLKLEDLDVIQLFKNVFYDTNSIPEGKDDPSKMTFWLGIPFSLSEKINGLTYIGKLFIYASDFYQRIDKLMKKKSRYKKK